MNVSGNLVGLTGTGTNLNVNCATGCTAGTVNNGLTNVATSSTNLGAVSWLYGFNGTQWDQLTTVAFNSTASTGRGLQVNAWVANAATPGRAAASASSPVVEPSIPTTYHLATTSASTNASAPKGSAAVVFSCQLGNNTTTAAFFKIFNKATSPTLGTDVPVVTLIMPGPAAGGGGSNVVFGSGGLALGTGFAVATTGGIGDLDSTTAGGAGGITANCQYE
jgi:hypothetical protein